MKVIHHKIEAMLEAQPQIGRALYLSNRARLGRELATRWRLSQDVARYEYVTAELIDVLRKQVRQEVVEDARERYAGAAQALALAEIRNILYDSPRKDWGADTFQEIEDVLISVGYGPRE